MSDSGERRQSREATPAFEPWHILCSDDDVSIVVPEGTSKATALVHLVAEEYGGDLLPTTNPVIVQALDSCSDVGEWRRYSEGLMEAVGIDHESYGDWWGPGGDGPDVIHAMTCFTYVYGLGDEAWTWEAVTGMAAMCGHTGGDAT